MPSRLEMLLSTLERGFPLGADLPSFLADAERVERAREEIAGISTDDLVVEMVGDEEFRRTRDGVEGFIDAWRDWTQSFDTFRVEVEDAYEQDPHVIVLVRQVGVPRGGETEIENKGGAIWTFDGDRLRRVEFHLNRETLLRATAVDPDSP